MKTRKICLLGDFGVGKTSLTTRFVRNVFSERYQTTVGVKIDTKEIDLRGLPMKLVIWDLAGRDALSTASIQYLRGAAGYLLVADATRAASFEAAKTLHREAQQVLGVVPFVTLLNKADLTGQREIAEDSAAALTREGYSAFDTSALSGENVERAFALLAERIA
jgi:small GTP-binding protein